MVAVYGARRVLEGILCVCVCVWTVACVGGWADVCGYVDVDANVDVDMEMGAGVGVGMGGGGKVDVGVDGPTCSLGDGGRTVYPPHEEVEPCLSTVHGSFTSASASTRTGVELSRGDIVCPYRSVYLSWFVSIRGRMCEGTHPCPSTRMNPSSIYVLGTGTGGLSAVTPLHAFATLSKRACVEGSGYTSEGKISAARDVDVDLASESMLK